MSRDVRRIAVFRPGGLQEMFAAVPALRALRFGFPPAEITLIGQPWAGQFAQQYGHYIDRFVPFPGEIGGERRDRFLAAQRERSYDLAIQLHDADPASNRLIAELGAWVCAGYYLGTPPDNLSVAAPYPDESDELTRCLALVRLLGCPDYGPEPEFPLFFEDRRLAATLLSDLPPHRPRVGIHPGGRSSDRRWTAESFAAVGDELTLRYGASIVLLGDMQEREISRLVAQRMDTLPRDLTGRTTLGGLGAVLHQLDLIIGNESGPAYLARATGTPSITLSTDLDAPSSEAWSIHQHCPLASCPEHVVRIAEQLLCLADSSIRGIARTPSVAARPGPSGWAQLP
jgi:ADP-heptose:LPS heptosyltransferase